MKKMTCPHCHAALEVYDNPTPTVDAIIEVDDGIVLIERRNPPYGWALPGGFVDAGERLEDAVVREAREETGLDVELVCQFHTYGDPGRDPRKHTVSIVYVTRGRGEPRAGDDAQKAAVFTEHNLPELAFDHAEILSDYFAWRRRLAPLAARRSEVAGEQCER